MDWISNLEKVFNDMDCPRSVTCNKLSKIEEHSYIVATTIRFETWEEQDAIGRSDRNEGRTNSQFSHQIIGNNFTFCCWL